MQLEDYDCGNQTDVTGAPIINTNHIAVNLDQFPQATSFKRIYGQYKISKVKVEFIPIHQRDVNTGPTTGRNVPTFVTYCNRVSDTFPGSLQQALSVPYAKQSNAGKYHKHYFSPCTFDNVFRPGMTTSAALQPEYNQWFPTAYSDVNHHGITWLMSQAGSAWPRGSFEYRVVLTIYTKFKARKPDTTV